MASSNLAQLLKQRIAANNPIETAARHFTDEAKNQLKPARKDILDQLLGDKKLTGPTEMQPGQEFSLSNIKKSESASNTPEKKPSRAVAAIEYFTETRRISERSNSRESMERKQQIDRLIAEVQRLAKSSKIVEQKFASFAVGQTVVTPGKYHTNFLEWMIFVIGDARRKVEDAGAWLSSMSGKKGKKTNALLNAQRTGNTAFSQSSERSAVISTG